MILVTLATTPVVAGEPSPTTGPSPGARASPPVAPLAPELQVKAWRVFGTGKADAGLDAINPPDGVAFTADGLLLATDAMNHRVQVFDPMSGAHLGSFGGPDVFAGEVVGIAVASDGRVLVSDEVANRAYPFNCVGRHPPRFVSAGPPVLADGRFQKLTGITYDSAGRLYAIDGRAGEVRRYVQGLAPDPDWSFQVRRPDGNPMLTRAEGIAIDEKTGTIFLASERDGMVRACDIKSGRWLGKTIGQRTDPVSAGPIGRSVFSRSIEGLAILGDYLLAVDEGSDQVEVDRPGRLLLFDIRDPAVYDTDAESCRARIACGKPAGLIGWVGTFLSPDGVATFAGSPEPLVAVADQGRYRVVVYRGNELIRAARAASSKSRP